MSRSKRKNGRLEIKKNQSKGEKGCYDINNDMA